MKKAIFAITVLALIIAAGIGEQVFIHRLFDELHQRSTRIVELLQQEDMPAAHDQTVQLQQWWEHKKHALEAIVSHNDTKEVALRIAELEGYIAIDDIKSSYATATMLVENSTNIPHLLGFSWDTVV